MNEPIQTSTVGTAIVGDPDYWKLSVIADDHFWVRRAYKTCQGVEFEGDVFFNYALALQVLEAKAGLTA